MRITLLTLEGDLDWDLGWGGYSCEFGFLTFSLLSLLYSGLLGVFRDVDLWCLFTE